MLLHAVASTRDGLPHLLFIDGGILFSWTAFMHSHSVSVDAQAPTLQYHNRQYLPKLGTTRRGRMY
jgi:hypothetical protein